MVSGGAFRKAYQFASEREKDRFFFILNGIPLEDRHLVIVTATTQINKRTRVRRSEVLVRLDVSDYDSLEEPSVIDCESKIVWDREFLLAEIDAHRVQPLKQLPAQIMAEIRMAVRVCKTWSADEKRLVLGEEEA